MAIQTPRPRPSRSSSRSGCRCGWALLAVVFALAAGARPAAGQPAYILRKGSEERPVEVATRDGVPVYRQVIVSPAYTVDRIYRSMQGPASLHPTRLGWRGRPELLWMTGYSAVMVEPDGETRTSQEFMCHSNLVMTEADWKRRFPSALNEEQYQRLFTLAQGQFSVSLPAGFGLPLMSDQPLDLQSQVLNHNITGTSFPVRHRTTIEYRRDADLADPMVPLVVRAVSGLKVVEGEDGYYGVPPDEVDPELHGAGCLAGQAMKHSVRHADGQGRVFTGHWVVPPGREVNYTPATAQLELPYDTTVHYIAAHLHPFAESLELRDLTAGRTVFKSRARNATDRTLLAEVQSLASVAGLPLHRDHEYQIVTIYENTSGVDQDAMATLFLYLRAPDLEERIARMRAAARKRSAGTTGPPS